MSQLKLSLPNQFVGSTQMSVVCLVTLTLRECLDEAYFVEYPFHPLTHPNSSQNINPYNIHFRR